MTAPRYDVDAIATVEEYLDRSDWRVNANANQGYSLGGLILNSAGKIVANYWLEHVYTPEIGAPHREGDYHIHDLDMFAGYCAGWSLKRLIQEGFNGVGGAIASAPPKHFSSACGQIVNFLGTLQNEWAGAQAFSSFDTYWRPSCAWTTWSTRVSVHAGAHLQPERARWGTVRLSRHLHGALRAPGQHGVRRRSCSACRSSSTT